MAKKRVKVKAEPIKQIEEAPKVREKAPKRTLKKIEKVLAEVVPTEKVDNKRVLTDNRFEKHKAFGDTAKRVEITEKVKQGLLKWAFYAIDNDNGYQYYLKIKK
jgi:hypothetical protein